jgi:hypothetical protein
MKGFRKEYIITSKLPVQEVKERLQQVIETGPRHYGLFKKPVNKEFEGEILVNSFTINKGNYITPKINIVISGTFEHKDEVTLVVLKIRYNFAVLVSLVVVVLTAILNIFLSIQKEKWWATFGLSVLLVFFVLNFFLRHSNFKEESDRVATFFRKLLK